MSSEDVLREIAVDVAIVKTRVECLPDLVERIEKLERADVRRTAWAAGAGAAVSAVFTAVVWTLARLHLLMLVLFAVACAAVPLERPSGPASEPDRPPLGDHWPYHVAMIADEALGEDCLIAIDDALDFWRSKGVEKINRFAVTKNLEPELGIITVTTGDPDNPDFAAVTVFQTVGDEIQWADINFRYGFCTANVAAHEMGHALGLDDDYENVDNVMFWATHGQGFDVTEEQLESIR